MSAEIIVWSVTDIVAGLTGLAFLAVAWGYKIHTAAKFYIKNGNLRDNNNSYEIFKGNNPPDIVAYMVVSFALSLVVLLCIRVWVVTVPIAIIAMVYINWVRKQRRKQEFIDVLSGKKNGEYGDENV